MFTGEQIVLTLFWGLFSAVLWFITDKALKSSRVSEKGDTRVRRVLAVAVVLLCVNAMLILIGKGVL